MSDVNRHTYDGAEYVNVASGTAFGDPTGSPVDLQTALEQISPNALQPLPQLPSSTDEDLGIIRHATLEEIQEGILDDVAISAGGFGTYLTTYSPPTEDNYGLFKINTDITVSDDNDEHAITIKKLNTYLDNRQSTETMTGVSYIASLSDIDLGTDNSKYVTTEKTILTILDRIADRHIDATTTESGVVRLASQSEANSNNASTIISPLTASQRVCTEGLRGFATNGADSTAIITPFTILDNQATESEAGFVKLVNSLSSSATDAAITATQGNVLDDKLGITGGTINGTLVVNTVRSDVSYLAKQYTGGNKWVYRNVNTTVNAISDGKLNGIAGSNGRPVGSIYVSTNNTDPSYLFGGQWTQINGRALMGQGTGQDTRGERRSFNAWNTGGNWQETVSISQMPNHKHASWGEHYDTRTTNECLRWSDGSYYGYWWARPYCLEYKTVSVTRFGVAYNYGRNNYGMEDTDYDNYMYYSEPVGGSRAHNNIQPYHTFYIWRRQA